VNDNLRAAPRAWLLPLIFLAGCGSDPRENTAGGTSSREVVQTASHLDLAMQAIATMPVSKDNENHGRALHNLNQWIAEIEEPAKKFVRDPLLAQTPRAYVKTQPLLDLERRNFDPADLLYLQQCLWLRDIANRVAPRPAPAELQPWLKELERRIGITAAEHVRSAERLFDWTICNIQLDKLPPPPRSVAAVVGKSVGESVPGPLRGEMGPGYWQLPWQTLLFGHGDAWQRSRVFLLMCRQAGITAHMLGVQDTAGSGAVRPWLCGVLVQGELYLFDAELGLPILGPDQGGIATLKQVVADPGLIRAMDIPGEAPYRVSDAELQGIQVLIDADPESLTLRMQLLESALIGDQRVVLARRPSDEEQQVGKCQHVKRVSLWRISLEALLYQGVLANMRQRDRALQAAYQKETYMFFPPNGIAEARHLQFEGQFYAQGEERKRGACQVFAQLRMPDASIESLKISSEARRVLGMRDDALSPDAELRSRQIEDFAEIARRTNDHATYWISLCHFDAGDYQVAAEWFRDRTLGGNQESPWLAAARYNLARCYEAEGKWEQARELYLNDESPQKLGNFLRAQRIAGRGK
jgi:Anaphase-promoting complex, cyclosome, subunit 3